MKTLSIIGGVIFIIGVVIFALSLCVIAKKSDKEASEIFRRQLKITDEMRT